MLLVLFSSAIINAHIPIDRSIRVDFDAVDRGVRSEESVCECLEGCEGGRGAGV